MSCKTAPRTAAAFVYTNGTTTAHFVPVSNPIPTGNYARVRSDFDVQVQSGNAQLQAGIRTSDDSGVTWSTALTLGGILSSGRNIGATVNLNQNAQLLQVGLFVANISGTKVEKAAVQLVLHLKE